MHFFSAIFLVSASTDSVAQYGRSTDGVRGPNVFVDMEVLRNLGPARSVPSILQPTLRQPRMPSVRDFGSRYPNLRAPGSATGRIVLKRPSSLKSRKSKRRASNKRANRLAAPRLTPPKMAQKPKSAPPMIRPGPRPRHRRDGQAAPLREGPGAVRGDLARHDLREQPRLPGLIRGIPMKKTPF